MPSLHRWPIAPLRDLSRLRLRYLHLKTKESDFITSGNVAELFSISERAARNLLTAWVTSGFVVIAPPAKKSPKYGLSSACRAMIDT